MKNLGLALAFVVLSVLVPFNAKGSLFIDDHFSMGVAEDMVVPFDTIGQTSTNSYSDLVRIQVSGTGESNGSIVNDALFYVDPFDYKTAFYISFTGDPRRLEGDGVIILPFITFFDGEGFVSYDASNAPPYNPDHFYDFIVDIGPGSKQISLGTGDGGLFDNTGQYKQYHAHSGSTDSGTIYASPAFYWYSWTWTRRISTGEAVVINHLFYEQTNRNDLMQPLTALLSRRYAVKGVFASNTQLTRAPASSTPKQSDDDTGSLRPRIIPQRDLA